MISLAERVLIAMSGGVDSTAAAYILRSQGYECIGATMRLFGGDESGLRDAADAAALLGIPHETVYLEEAFRRHVIENFVRTYAEGETPNPCIECNKHLKFGALIGLADELGCRFIATGHYARIEQDERTGRFLLKKALDPARDQSYVLYGLTQEKLSRIIFPLGSMTKREVRETAARAGFANADRPDSQDICFVPDGDYAAFIERHIGSTFPCGNFTDINGNILGRHRGIIHYTIGQRKGLGIAAKAPLYVRSLNAADNAVVLGGEDNILFKTVTACNANLISVPRIASEIRVSVKLRFRQHEQPAFVTQDGDTLTIRFDNPQRAPAPGQAAVLYDGDIVVGGGRIIKDNAEN